MPKVNALMDIFGPTDLVNVSIIDLNISIIEFFKHLNNQDVVRIPKQFIEGIEMIYNFIGNYNYETWKNANPTHYVIEVSLPHCIIHGRDDELASFI